MKYFFVLLISIGVLYTSCFSQDFADDFCLCEKHPIASGVLNEERLLFIYLPNDYAKDTTNSFPVVYVSDAPATSNLYFDILRLHGLMNYVPQSIVVGLSSDDRNHHLNPEKGADKYLKFIKDEVIPFVDKTYRTESLKILAGHSLGGDFVIYSLLKDPDLFRAYITGSPGPIEPISKLIVNTEPLVTNQNYTFFYSSVGSNDFTDTISFRNFERQLKRKTMEEIDFYFHINQGEHHISNIAINFQNGIRQLFHDWQFQLPDTLDNQASEMLKAHYDHLENKLGYRPAIGEWEVIYPAMDKLARRGDFKNTIDILKYCIQLYPTSDQAHAFLAKAYFDTGNMELGKQYLNKSLELNPQNQFALQIKKMLEKQ